MIQRTGTVRYDSLRNRAEIINGRGLQHLWVCDRVVIASGDKEDLPLTTEPWVEVSERQAWETVQK